MLRSSNLETSGRPTSYLRLSELTNPSGGGLGAPSGQHLGLSGLFANSLKKPHSPVLERALPVDPRARGVGQAGS